MHIKVDEEFFKKVENLKKYFEQLEDNFKNSKDSSNKNLGVLEPSKFGNTKTSKISKDATDFV